MRFAAVSSMLAILCAVALAGCTRQPQAPATPAPISSPAIIASTESTFLMREGSFRVFASSDGPVQARLRVDRSGASSQPELLLSVWRGQGPESFAPDQTISIEQRMQFFVPLFQKYLQEGGPGSRFYLMVYGYRELNERLTCLAARNADWNRKTGMPKVPQAGFTYFQNLLQEGDADKEVVQTLQRLHYRTTLAGGLENLRVAPVASFTAAQHEGLCTAAMPTDLLPVRIAATFTVTEITR